jgi:malonate transporter
MLAPVNYAQLLFPDFSLILIGYLVRRYTALDRSVWEPVEGLVYYFLFPVLLFHSIVRNPLDLAATSGLIGAGLLMGLAGIALAASTPGSTRAPPRSPSASTPSSRWRWPNGWPAAPAWR